MGAEVDPLRLAEVLHPFHRRLVDARGNVLLSCAPNSGSGIGFPIGRSVLRYTISAFMSAKLRLWKISDGIAQTVLRSGCTPVRNKASSCTSLNFGS